MERYSSQKYQIFDITLTVMTSITTHYQMASKSMSSLSFKSYMQRPNPYLTLDIFHIHDRSHWASQHHLCSLLPDGVIGSSTYKVTQLWIWTSSFTPPSSLFPKFVWSLLPTLPEEDVLYPFTSTSFPFLLALF